MLMKGENWKEIKSMTKAELDAKLDGLKDRIFKLKFRNSVSVLKNPLEIRETRRDIARIKTILAIKRKAQIDNGKE
jgi:large subunit ribosomal protein L29